MYEYDDIRAYDMRIRTLDSFLFETAVYARELKRRPDGLPLHRTESACNEQGQEHSSCRYGQTRQCIQSTITHTHYQHECQYSHMCTRIRACITAPSGNELGGNARIARLADHLSDTETCGLCFVIDNLQLSTLPISQLLYIVVEALDGNSVRDRIV